MTENNETFTEPVTWTDWKRTFLFLPRRSIGGGEIIGFAWTRMIELGIHEYEDAIGYHIRPSGEGLQYARNKKEIFLYNLQEGN